MHRMVSKVHQGVHILHGNQVNTAAIATVTAIRPAHRDVFLTPKTNSPITAVTRLYANFGLINKSHTRRP
jgi:hypothetical protein